MALRVLLRYRRQFVFIIFICACVFSWISGFKANTYYGIYRDIDTTDVITYTKAPVFTVPPTIYHGIPYPRCIQKLKEMEKSNDSIPCFPLNNNSTLKEKVEYLSETKDCPVVNTSEIRLEAPYFKDVNATPRTSFKEIYDRMSGLKNFDWMMNRIKNMETLWVQAAKKQFLNEKPRKKKRIHIHPGLLETGLAKRAGKGAPVGELIQWSDLIASVYIMGHDIVITENKKELELLYNDFFARTNNNCKRDIMTRIPFDVIYIDILGYKNTITNFNKNALDVIKCRIRVLDTWGTEVDFNNPEYAKLKNNELCFYCGLDLDARQFNSLYPHTPDNTFMGFVIENTEHVETNKSGQRNIALLYAKSEGFLEKKFEFIDIIKEYVTEVHSTLSTWSKSRKYIINHGILPFNELCDLLHKTKIFIGFGIPKEGPGPIEAIYHGAVFINRKVMHPEPLKKKPTSRVLTSQNPYLESLGKPYVYTIDIDNKDEVRATLKEIMERPEPGEHIPFEFTAGGMLQRMSVLLEKQQFCVPVPYVTDTASPSPWPPISALKKVILGNVSESCNTVCDREDLICEPSFFPILNRKEAFDLYDVGVTCRNTSLPENSDLDYPAYDVESKTCFLQTDPRLFSCAKSYKRMRRLCPCRDYILGQKALCKNCLLP